MSRFEFQSPKDSHRRRRLEPGVVHVDLPWKKHQVDWGFPCQLRFTSSPVAYSSTSSKLPESGHI